MPRCHGRWYRGEYRKFDVELGGNEADVGHVVSVWRGLEQHARTEHRRLANAPMVVATAAAIVESKKRTWPSRVVATDSAASSELAVRPPGQDGWPVRYKRSGVSQGDPSARARAEQDKRVQWLLELRDEAFTANIPSVNVLVASPNCESLYTTVVQGRQARTIRRRVLGWRVAVCVIKLSFGVSWPRNVGGFPSIPRQSRRSWKAMLYAQSGAVCTGFVPLKSGGIPAADHLSANPLMQAAVEQLTLQVR